MEISKLPPSEEESKDEYVQCAMQLITQRSTTFCFSAVLKVSLIIEADKFGPALHTLPAYH